MGKSHVEHHILVLYDYMHSLNIPKDTIVAFPTRGRNRLNVWFWKSLVERVSEAVWRCKKKTQFGFLSFIHINIKACPCPWKTKGRDSCFLGQRHTYKMIIWLIKMPLVWFCVWRVSFYCLNDYAKKHGSLLQTWWWCLRKRHTHKMCTFIPP